MTRAARTVLAFGLLTAAPAAVRAESYCVACFGPDAVYRCLIAGTLETAPADPRNQIQCVKQLAKTGGHARCSVERFSTSGCEGVERIIEPSAAVVPLAPPPAAIPGVPSPTVKEKDAAAAPARPLPDRPAAEPTTTGLAPATPGSKPGADTPDAPAQGEPPRTVEDLAKTTVESTKKGLDDVAGAVKKQTEKAGDQMQGAGSAINEAAKKSWHCLTSFFTDC